VNTQLRGQLDRTGTTALKIGIYHVFSGAWECGEVTWALGLVTPPHGAVIMANSLRTHLPLTREDQVTAKLITAQAVAFISSAESVLWWSVLLQRNGGDGFFFRTGGYGFIFNQCRTDSPSVQ
jgi:hypothetical protein